MEEVTTFPSVVEGPAGPGTLRLASHRLAGLTAWLFKINADRWRRRALFYERHRDYFPRLSSGRFVDRCHELEETYRGLAQVMFNLPPQVQLVPARATGSRLK
jgi:hypothetical protein